MVGFTPDFLKIFEVYNCIHWWFLLNRARCTFVVWQVFGSRSQQQLGFTE